MTAINPAKDWNWEKETQSRILATLDEIACMIVNMHRKKGAKKAKPDKQFQPDYVEQAKKKAAESKKKSRYTEEEMENIKKFWAMRNPRARRL